MRESRWIYVDNLSDDVQKKSEIVSEARVMAEVFSYFHINRLVRFSSNFFFI